MTIRDFLHFSPPQTFSDFNQVASTVRRMWDALKPLRKGKLECVGEVTLTANAASTTFNRNGISIQTFIGFDPRTANAAAELAAGTMYITDANRSENSVVITHANNANADRTFFVLTIG